MQGRRGLYISCLSLYIIEFDSHIYMYSVAQQKIMYTHVHTHVKYR